MDEPGKALRRHRRGAPLRPPWSLSRLFPFPLSFASKVLQRLRRDHQPLRVMVRAGAEWGGGSRAGRSLEGDGATTRVALLGCRFVSPRLISRWSNELESMRASPAPTIHGTGKPIRRMIGMTLAIAPWRGLKRQGAVPTDYFLFLVVCGGEMSQQYLPVKFSKTVNNHICPGQVLFIIESIAKANTEHFCFFSGKDTIFRIFYSDTSVRPYTQAFCSKEIDRR
jgi:hypothetical protein